jgi:ADP-ribose pyrophosphatase YjhB (NUDIX family)
MDTLTQVTSLYKRYGTPALTNFRIEDVTGNGPDEAGVFTLADLKGSVVLIRREPQVDYPGIETFWWIPGGGHEASESLDEAAVREFREETGLEVHIERLLVARVTSEHFFTFWFRGHVVAGNLSPYGDPCNTTAEVKVFASSDILVETLWSDIDKIVLAYEGFIDYPIESLLMKHSLRTQSEP